MKVLIDTSPLNNAHAIRGVGSYTRFLTEALEKKPGLELRRSSWQESDCKPELIHYPFFDLFFPTLPLWRPVKTVVTIHDVIPLLFPKYYPVGKRGRLAFLKQKLALKTVEAVITDSQASKIDIEKHLGVAAEKIHVIYLAANPFLRPVEKKTVNKWRRKFKLPKQYLLYVGDINYNKNLPQLIKALRYLPENLHLVCVGKNFQPQEIPEWQWIESQIALSNVRSRCHFVTEVLGNDHESLAALYSGALAYVQPSLYEGFGLPILEAMTCQTPVICGRNSALLEVASDKALLVEEESAEAFAMAIEKILVWKKQERRQFVLAAARHAAKFSWQKTATATFKVYQEVLS